MSSKPENPVVFGPDLTGGQISRDYSKLATLLDYLGRALLSLGTPAFRIEAVLSLFAKRMGADAQVMSTPTMMIITIRKEQDERTFMIRENPGPADLGKLARLPAPTSDPAASGLSTQAENHTAGGHATGCNFTNSETGVNLQRQAATTRGAATGRQALAERIEIENPCLQVEVQRKWSLQKETALAAGSLLTQVQARIPEVNHRPRGIPAKRAFNRSQVLDLQCKRGFPIFREPGDRQFRYTQSGCAFAG